MTGPNLAPLTAAGLLVTDWCPAECRHCYVCAGPSGGQWMSVEAAAGHLAALKRMGVPAQGIHIGGGEPFGDFDRLLAILRAAGEAGYQGVGYVETNGFWAESEDLVRRRLTELDRAGLRQLAISADPYHQEFIAPGRVRLLLEVARSVLGPGRVRARRWKWLQAPEDVAAMAEPRRLALFRAFLARYPERMSGRAARRLASLTGRTPVDALPDVGCRPALLESRHVHVDPQGWVYPGTCAGIALGRASVEEPIDALLAGWRLEAGSAVCRLVEGGPKHLLAEAEGLGFRPDPAGYAGPCHLCWSIRVHLVRAGAGAGVLEPSGVYREG